MKLLFRHPFIVLPAKFLGRIMMGALWGILLSPLDQDVKFAVAAGLGVLLLSLTPFFVSWDRAALSASRVALYGLLIAGEAMAVGAMVLAALGAFSGHADTYLPLMVVAAFGGTVLTLYPTAIMHRDNMGERRDQR